MLLYKDQQDKFLIQWKKGTMKSQLILVFGLFLAAADNAALQEVTTANNLFAQSLYKQFSKNSEGNVLVSPFSAETVLAFAQSGSKGETAEKIATALHLPALKSRIPKFQGKGLYTLHTADEFYVQKNFSIKEEFKNAAIRIYHADSETINSTNKVDAARIINNWVEKHTNNKTKNLISSYDLDKDTRAGLINAFYFQANWSNPFRLATTTKRNFYKTATDVLKVDSLTHWKGYFNYYESPHLKAQFLELPFKGDEVSMVFVLSNDKNGVAALENQLDQVFEPRHHLTSEYLNVVLPKFRIGSSIDFKNVLGKRVKKVFDEEHAEQKTEEGVEAAAATYVLVAADNSANDRLEIPKDFIADHPFIFYIKAKGLIIFAGRVTDPTIH